MERRGLVRRRRDRRPGDRKQRVVERILGHPDRGARRFEHRARVAGDDRRAAATDRAHEVAHVRAPQRLEVRADARDGRLVARTVGQCQQEFADQWCIHARRIIGDVRRPLAPYAIAAVLVFVLSVAALTAALATGGLLEERTTSTSSPSPSASRAPVELSRAGRIAYWRPDPSSGNQLWVSNLDGSGRQPIATIDLISRVSLTRWSPDGSSVAYADRSQAVVVQRLDGLRSELPLPTALASGGFRLIDLSWSTDSRFWLRRYGTPAAN